MTSLPPYSTYRTDNKQMLFPQAKSFGNTLTFTPPGFKQSLNVKFPDSRLAVCEKCKKNFKTRDMCRVRNTHTDPPWTTAYICLTLDDSCLDENGKYIDGPMTVRMVQWQPFHVTKPFGPKTPVCSACKKTNRTRSFCRERHKHRQLPWCTVYVLLSALEAVDPSTVVADPSKPVADEDRSQEKTPGGSSEREIGSGDAFEENEDGSEIKAASSAEKDSNDGTVDSTTSGEAKAARPKSGSDDGEESDDINDIPESRTFLAKVSSKSTTIHWLELSESESSDALHHGMAPADPVHAMGVPGGAPVQNMDPNQAQYYAHAMGYAGQQHQNALKAHQQYFFMQQRQQQQHQHQYASAWQPQYNPQPPPPPPHMHIPHGQVQPPQPQAGGSPTPEEGGPPITAGEAAAQQQKRHQQGEDSTRQPHHLHHPPPQQHPPHPPQQHPHSQQHWGVYPQVYPPHSQFQQPGSTAMPPHPGHAPVQHTAMAPPLDQQIHGAPSAEDKPDDEGNVKRQRLV